MFALNAILTPLQSRLYASKSVESFRNEPFIVACRKPAIQNLYAAGTSIASIAVKEIIGKEVEMANKNKQFDSLQGKQGNDSQGIETLQSEKSEQDSEKPTGKAAQGNVEGLQKGGSRGNSNQGNSSIRGS
jgi:hypothetical protein